MVFSKVALRITTTPFPSCSYEKHFNHFDGLVTPSQNSDGAVAEIASLRLASANFALSHLLKFFDELMRLLLSLFLNLRSVNCFIFVL